MLKKKERNALFNDALYSFYLQLYGVGHMVKDHSAREETRCHHCMDYFFSISSKGSFICTIPQKERHIPWPSLQQSWITGWKE